MGAKQSKRSVDITNTPTKGEVETIGEGEGRVVKIGDADIKATTNGAVPHTDLEITEKDENAKDLTVEKENTEKDVVEVKENGVSESEEAKTPDSDSVEDNLNETEKSPENTENKIEETPEAKKQKEKKKKKWSFRSISFSKKDKSKPSKESEKNGDVKEVAEENVDESAVSPTTESPKKEKPESTEPAPVLNGEASKDEIVNETPTSEDPAPVEEPKKEEPAVAEPVKQEVAKVESVAEEPKAEQPKPVEAEPPKVPEPVVESAPSPKEQEEPTLINPPLEETKEVRNEELPPPLPSSNPPSSVTVFAESTKADILTTAQIDLLQNVAVEPSKEVAKPDFCPVVDVQPTLLQEFLKSTLETEVLKKPESEPKLEPEKSSETEVAKNSELESIIPSEKPILESPDKATIEPKIEKSVVEPQNSEIEVAELNSQPDVSESSLSEIKVASESLISIPDPVLSEPDVAKKSETIIQTCETKVANEQSITSLQPQPSETNLLKDALSEENVESQKSECSTEQTLPSEKAILEPSVPVISQKSEPLILADIEPKLEPLVELDLNPKTSIPEGPQQKSEPNLKSETLNTSSEISETCINEPNKTEPTESLSSLPPQVLDLIPSPNTTDLNSAKVEPELENNELIEAKKDDHITPKLSTSDVYKDCSQPSIDSEDSLHSAKSSDPVIEVEDKHTVSSIDPQNLDLSSIPAQSNPPSELSLVYSEDSSTAIPVPESVPEPIASVENPEEPKSPKIDDSESKSISEDSPVDLPSPSDLPPPSSAILDRLVDPTDSLQDISTESLPSLPEPISENLAEPMSLPPVDSVPEPIATDCLPPSDSVPLPPPVLTNGNTNGLHSPNEEDALKLKEGPLKQVPPTEAPSEVVKEEAEKAAPVEAAKVEE